MQTVRDLLREAGIENQQLRAEVLDLPVQGVTSDSREAKKGMVFVAIRGVSQDAHAFIPQVQQAGASLIIGEKALSEISGLTAPYLQLENTRAALAHLADAFHGHPSRAMKMIGVTGTSGKTTTTYLIESILKAAGHRVGVIGTVNFRFEDKIIPSTHTTPGPVELQKLLAGMRADGCTAVVMEVSSHALKQHRADAIAWDGAVFSNLSPEHMDFHPDMEDYFQSKKLLFTRAMEESIRAGKKPHAAINLDDSHGQRLARELKDAGAPKLVTYSVQDSSASFVGSTLKIDLGGIRGRVGTVEVQSALTGLFNASNILAALSVTSALGVTPEKIGEGLKAIQVVPGRLERVPNSKGIHVMVDYAHKPDALEKVLRTLGQVKGANRLITVFGCGGDRDRTKRPVMGKLAVELSDHVFVTSDNPRTENPDAIIEEILVGSGTGQQVTVEADRKKAIHAAIRYARSGDLVLIAGKGHEDYQIILDPRNPGKTMKIHFDDREVAAEALQLP